MLVYAAVVALSVPGAAIMTLAGGFLFGIVLGASLTVIGATLGATLLFLIARSAAGDFLRQRAGPFLARMSDGFSKDAFNYLLFLRLVPAFPFWAVNLAPALLGMRLAPFVIATALGIIPGTVVYTAFGASLGHVFDAGGQVDLKTVFSPTLIAALIGLGLLALVARCPETVSGEARVTLSVVIPTLNAAATLSATLASLDGADEIDRRGRRIDRRHTRYRRTARALRL